MKSPEDVRFNSDAAPMTASECVTVPVTVAARKPTFDVALQAIKEVLHKLLSEADALGLGSVDLDALNLRCQHEPKGTVLVELAAVLTVKWGPETVGFWARAEGIAWCLDLVQRYCELTKPGSDIAVYTAKIGGRESGEYRPKGA